MDNAIAAAYPISTDVSGYVATMTTITNNDGADQNVA
jgi:hypothetical protein